MKHFSVTGTAKENYINAIKDAGKWIDRNAENFLEGFNNHLRSVEIKVVVEPNSVVVGDVKCEYFIDKGEEENEIA